MDSLFNLNAYSNSAATKPDWETMLPPRWQQPELSAGAQCAALDFHSRRKCWCVKNGSPADAVWRIVSMAITKLLEEHLEARDSMLNFGIFMVGSKLEKSIPTVLFSCESAPCRRRSMGLVHKRGLLSDYPGVMMAESSLVSRPLDKKNGSNLPFLSPGVYLNGEFQTYGTPVLISIAKDQLPRKATLGGFIYTGFGRFAITAAHPFSNPDFAFYGGIDPSPDDEFDTSFTSRVRISSGLFQFPFNQPDKEYQGFPSLNLASGLHDKSPESNEKWRNLRRGGYAPISHSLGCRGGSFTNPGEKLDWALVKMDSFLFGSTQSHIAWKGKELRPREIAAITSDHEVLIVTIGRISEGKLSGVPSFTIAAGERTFRKVWTVTRLTGTFENGECGSWVVDCESGALYGHLVSGYPGTATGQIVSSAQIFEEIQRNIGKCASQSPEFSNFMECWTSDPEPHQPGHSKSNGVEFTENDKLLPNLDRLPSMPFSHYTGGREKFQPSGSNSIPTSSNSRNKQRLLATLAYKPLISNGRSSSAKNLGQIASKDVKSPYARPKHDRVYCSQCKDHPDGFRGEHELRRHQYRQHEPRKKWLCREPKDGTHLVPEVPLSKCKACIQKIRYGEYYTAAAHLRRSHFRVKRNGRNVSADKRAGQTGSHFPPMSELKHWMEEIEEVSIAGSALKEDDEGQESDTSAISYTDETYGEGPNSWTWSYSHYNTMNEQLPLPDTSTGFVKGGFQLGFEREFGDDSMMTGQKPDDLCLPTFEFL